MQKVLCTIYLILRTLAKSKFILPLPQRCDPTSSQAVALSHDGSPVGVSQAQCTGAWSCCTVFHFEKQSSCYMVIQFVYVLGNKHGWHAQ